MPRRFRGGNSAGGSVLPAMIKWHHVGEGLARLVWDPFDFFGAMILFDGFAETAPLRAA